MPIPIEQRGYRGENIPITSKNPLLKLMQPHIDSVVVTYAPNFHNDFTSLILQERIRFGSDQGTTIHILQSHDSHVCFGIGELNSQLVKFDNETFGRQIPIKEGILPIAASLSSRAQGNILYVLYLLTRAANLPGHYQLRLIPQVRPKDKRLKVRGKNKSLDEQVKNAGINGYYFVNYPEGTVQGGRTDENGNLYGLQKKGELGIIKRLKDSIPTEDRTVIVIPSATYGTNEVLSPDAPYLTKAGRESLLRRRKPPEIKVNVASPLLVTWEDRIKDDFKGVAYQIMCTKASMLPYERRGDYRSLVYNPEDFLRNLR